MSSKKILTTLMNSSIKKRIHSLETKINYEFQNSSHLLNAIEHPSAKPNNKQFERLEFLGDRVLGLSIANLLLKKFPSENEGHLAKRLAYLVSKEACQLVATHLNLEKDLSTICDAGAASNISAIQADAVEAILGAIYLDGGFDACFRVVSILWHDIVQQDHELPKDPKSTLQEWLQKRKINAPQYVLCSSEGPAHQPILIYQVIIEGFPTFQGEGTNRKSAERQAAQNALDYIEKNYTKNR